MDKTTITAYSLRIDNLRDAAPGPLAPSVDYQSLEEAMRAFEGTKPASGMRATITEYEGPRARAVRTVGRGRGKGAPVAWAKDERA